MCRWGLRHAPLRERRDELGRVPLSRPAKTVTVRRGDGGVDSAADTAEHNFLA